MVCDARQANGAKLHFKGCHVSEEGSLEFQALAHSQGAADETEVYHTNAEFLNDVCPASPLSITH